jgi:hypothetical protein
MRQRKILIGVVAVALLVGLFEWLIPQDTMTFWAPLVFALILLFAIFYFDIPNYLRGGPPYEPWLEKRVLWGGVGLMAGGVLWCVVSLVLFGPWPWFIIDQKVAVPIILLPSMALFLVGGALVNSVFLSRPPK